MEARDQRDAAVQEASEKVEAMKECDGILGSFLMSFAFKFHLQLTCFLLPGLALHNQVEEVII
jgi:hypothetical protein